MWPEDVVMPAWNGNSTTARSLLPYSPHPQKAHQSALEMRFHPLSQRFRAEVCGPLFHRVSCYSCPGADSVSLTSPEYLNLLGCSIRFLLAKWTVLMIAFERCLAKV
jgi:hypothetical protein